MNNLCHVTIYFRQETFHHVTSSGVESFDNRPRASFEPNHVVAMKQCSHVDNPSTSRKISFAGRSSVAGKSEKKTQRRLYSFRFFLPPPMTV